MSSLRARRLELTRAALRESLLEDDLDHFRVVVETLTDEFDVMEVALAAVKLAHEATGGGEEETEEIPEYVPRADREPRGRRETGRREVGRRDGGGREPGGREPGGRPDRRGRTSAAGMTRLFVGLGRQAGIRPQDLVGAITGESSLSGRDIGGIEISERFSLVEVPEAAADEVIDALRGSTLKGRKPTVRRERS